MSLRGSVLGLSVKTGFYRSAKMRLLIVATTAFALSGIAVQAQDQAVRTGARPAWAVVSEPLPVPDQVRGPIFNRRQNVQTHLDKNGEWVFVDYLVKLGDSNALQLGNLALSWDPAAGTPTVHSIRVIRNGVERDVLAGSKFEILRREDQLEASMLTGRLTAVMRVPDLRVGDELEVSYTLPAQDPTLRDANAGAMFIGPIPAPGRYDLRLSWEQGLEPTIRPTADLAPLVQRGPSSVWVEMDNPAALNPPKDAPPRYAWQRLIEFTDFSDWKAVSSRMAPLFSKAAVLAPDSEIRKEAAEIAASSSDPMARTQAALKLVQQQVRYVYVGLNGGNLTPASADETWRRRYGDCKGKTVLLLALLNELGIPAEAVLASNAGDDDGLDQHLPNPLAFDHVLVRARIDGHSYWLDGTLPEFYQPSERPVLPYRWVLPLAAAGDMIERLPWESSANPDTTVLFEIDAREGFAVPAKIRQTTIARGPQALAEYYQLGALNENQLESAFRQELEGSSVWNSIESVTWRFDPGQRASVLEITGTGPVDWEQQSGKSRSLTLPGGGFSPPDRRQRGSSGTADEVPFYTKPEFDCRVTTVRLPADTAEKDWSYNTSFDVLYFGRNYRRSFERRDGAIRMVRSLRSLQPEISPAVAAADNDRLTKFDNSMASIFYDPGSYDRKGARERVPATYEVDWVANPLACLPSTVVVKN
ncbi:DUF3857 domain-containing protein [Novosphingobium sp.]|uniref:DUF3857 domain-containing protein n=1 Tax=Novosphingobium sp. TaxID=1874826 RepID=UPI00262EADD5|nr:DUF3857 domain-containing protein [Novosphingobium sp.]